MNVWICIDSIRLFQQFQLAGNKKYIINTSNWFVSQKYDVKKWLHNTKINKIIYNWKLYSAGFALFPPKVCQYWEEEINAPIP